MDSREPGIARHLPLFWLTDYSFDVSYIDHAGTPRRARMEANAELFTKHTLGAGRFTHHPIEVAFLAEDSTVVALPEILGGSIWGYVIATILFAMGCFIYRRSRHGQRPLERKRKAVARLGRQGVPDFHEGCCQVVRLVKGDD